MTPLHRDESYVEYRAVGHDDGGDVFAGHQDGGRPHRNRREAERDLAAMCEEADPPYDDAWIEERTVGRWKKSKR